MLVLVIFTIFNFISFFFSSRRRHTRSLCDWSSDVCSSDLVDECGVKPPARECRGEQREAVPDGEERDQLRGCAHALRKQDDSRDEEQVIPAGDHVPKAEPEVVGDRPVGVIATGEAMREGRRWQDQRAETRDRAGAQSEVRVPPHSGPPFPSAPPPLLRSRIWVTASQTRNATTGRK